MTAGGTSTQPQHAPALAVPARVPPSVVAAVAGRCRAVGHVAAGRVLEVPLPGAPGECVEDALRQPLSAGESYDTIVSLVRTPAVANVGVYVDLLDRLLAPGGSLLMVEPARVPPPRPAMARLHAALRRRPRTGDGIVAALWAGGFVVTDIHRFDLRTAPVPWRRFVELHARRPSTLASSHRSSG